MKYAVAVAVFLLLMSSAGFAQRFIPSAEQDNRRISAAPVVSAPECKQPEVLEFEAVVDESGKVAKIKKRNFILRFPESIVQKAQDMVKSLLYRPYREGGQPKKLRTYIRVPCVSPK